MNKIISLALMLSISSTQCIIINYSCIKSADNKRTIHILSDIHVADEHSTQQQIEILRPFFLKNSNAKIIIDGFKNREADLPIQRPKSLDLNAIPQNITSENLNDSDLKEYFYSFFVAILQGDFNQNIIAQIMHTCRNRNIPVEEDKRNITITASEKRILNNIASRFPNKNLCIFDQQLLHSCLDAKNTNIIIVCGLGHTSSIVPILKELNFNCSETVDSVKLFNELSTSSKQHPSFVHAIMNRESQFYTSNLLLEAISCIESFNAFKKIIQNQNRNDIPDIYPLINELKALS